MRTVVSNISHGQQHPVLRFAGEGKPPTTSALSAMRHPTATAELDNIGPDGVQKCENFSKNLHQVFAKISCFVQELEEFFKFSVVVTFSRSHFRIHWPARLPVF